MGFSPQFATKDETRVCLKIYKTTSNFKAQKMRVLNPSNFIRDDIFFTIPTFAYLKSMHVIICVSLQTYFLVVEVDIAIAWLLL